VFFLSVLGGSYDPQEVFPGPPVYIKSAGPPPPGTPHLPSLPPVPHCRAVDLPAVDQWARPPAPPGRYSHWLAGGKSHWSALPSSGAHRRRPVGPPARPARPVLPLVGGREVPLVGAAEQWSPPPSTSGPARPPRPAGTPTGWRAGGPTGRRCRAVDLPAVDQWGRPARPSGLYSHCFTAEKSHWSALPSSGRPGRGPVELHAANLQVAELGPESSEINGGGVSVHQIVLPS